MSEASCGSSCPRTSSPWNDRATHIQPYPSWIWDRETHHPTSRCVYSAILGPRLLALLVRQVWSDQPCLCFTPSRLRRSSWHHVSHSRFSKHGSDYNRPLSPFGLNNPLGEAQEGYVLTTKRTNRHWKSSCIMREPEENTGGYFGLYIT